MKALAIITRVHPNRPKMLFLCRRSVARQVSSDYEHLFIYDNTKTGYGVGLANKSFSQSLKISSRYVMVLDDDDVLVDDNLVKDIKEITADVIIFRGVVDGLPWSVLPPNHLWEKPIECGRIASFCMAARREIWEQHKASFGKAVSGGDFQYMKSVYDCTKDIYWHDKIVARTQRVSRGRSENE